MTTTSRPTQADRAQARLTRAADRLETLSSHLARYETRPEALWRHLTGDAHNTTPGTVDGVVLHAQHQQAHLAALVKAGRDLEDAEAWLAAVQQNEGMATLTGGER